jgi:hypothetical protein
MNMTGKLNILSSKDFENKIKELMEIKSPITMIDAIVLFCQQNNLEIETAASLISNKMKAVIESEAIKSKMIISKNAKLPI